MSVQTHEGMCAPVVQFKVQMNMKKREGKAQGARLHLYLFYEQVLYVMGRWVHMKWKQR